MRVLQDVKVVLNKAAVAADAVEKLTGSGIAGYLRESAAAVEQFLKDGKPGPFFRAWQLLDKAMLAGRGEGKGLDSNWVRWQDELDVLIGKIHEWNVLERKLAAPDPEGEETMLQSFGDAIQEYTVKNLEAGDERFREEGATGYHDDIDGRTILRKYYDDEKNVVGSISVTLHTDLWVRREEDGPPVVPDVILTPLPPAD